MNFANAKIYQIKSFQTDLVYVGSTCCPRLCQRLRAHRYDYNCWLKNKKKYVTSFEILKYDDHYIELVEDVECSSRDELRAREGYYIKTLKSVNICISGRSRKEWFNDNKEHIKQYQLKYREKNKDKLKKQEKLKYIKNKEKIKKRVNEYYHNNKDKRKEYLKKNKDKIKEYKKQYRLKNKDKLTEKFECDCGGTYTTEHKTEHIKSKKHIHYEKTNRL